jgi:hypothetical protein
MQVYVRIPFHCRCYLLYLIASWSPARCTEILPRFSFYVGKKNFSLSHALVKLMFSIQFPKEPNMGKGKKGSVVISAAGQHGRSIKHEPDARLEAGKGCCFLQWVAALAHISPSKL